MIDFFHNLSAKIRFQKSAFWTVKVAFLTVGIIVLKLALPYSANVQSTLSPLWISFHSWLIPPGNFIILIFIILAIKVSSSLQQKLSEMMNNKEVVSEAENRSRQQKSWDLDSKDSSFNRPKTSPEVWPEFDELSPDFIEKSPVSVEKSVEFSPEVCSDISCLMGSDEKENRNPARFPVIKSTEADQKTTVRSTAPSQKALKPHNVAKPKKQNDTVEAISGGRGKLEKRKTWDVPPRVSVIEPDSKPSSSSAASTPPELLRKSETLNVRASSASSRGGNSGRNGLRREKSLSQDESSASSGLPSGGGGGGFRESEDELYWRAEEFIKKFRLQMGRVN